MAKLMSKSELIQKIADQHSNGLSRKGYQGRHRVTRQRRLQRTQEDGSLLCARIREICCHQETCHKTAYWHQSFYKGTCSIQGQAS